MNSFFLDPTCGYSSDSPNGISARDVLDTTKDPDQILQFQRNLGLSDVWRGFQGRVIFIVGGGIGTSVSQARADRASQLYQEDPKNTRLMPTGRFTYRLLEAFSGQPEPDTTDVSDMSRSMVSEGVDPEHIIQEVISNCTLGNAAFSRILLGATGAADISHIQDITVVTSERAQLAFELLFPEHKIDYSTVSGDILGTNERSAGELENDRRRQETVVNQHLYRPIIEDYRLAEGTPEERLAKVLWYMRTINIGTPGNPGDHHNAATNAAMAHLRQYGHFDPHASYGTSGK